MRKICVVTGNRATYSRVKSVMNEIKKHPDLKLQLIVTASHLLEDFGKTVSVIKEDGFKIDAIARTIVSGEDVTSMAKSIGLCALEMPTLFEMLKPDIVVVLCDRFDALGTAVSAAAMNIPLAHIQGGEITGTIDESIRHAITKLSHIHFPATEESARIIRSMGENSNHVFNVGCPTVDIINNIKIGSKSDVFKKIAKSNTAVLDSEKPFIILIQHPVTTECSEAGKQMKETLKAVSSLNIQTILLYPNVDAGSKDIVRAIRLFGLNDNFRTIKHIVFEDFIRLLSYTDCIVGNSSSGIREACYFGTPVVNIGTRQNRRERADYVVSVDYDSVKIKEAILKELSHGKYEKEFIYGSGGSGKKIAKILAEIDLTNIIQKEICIRRFINE